MEKGEGRREKVGDRWKENAKMSTMPTLCQTAHTHTRSQPRLARQAVFCHGGRWAMYSSSLQLSACCPMPHAHPRPNCPTVLSFLMCKKWCRCFLRPQPVTPSCSPLSPTCRPSPPPMAPKVVCVRMQSAKPHTQVMHAGHVTWYKVCVEGALECSAQIRSATATKMSVSYASVHNNTH